MTPFEFVLIFLIGGVIILTVVGRDLSETNSVCAIISIALMHRIISRAKGSSKRLNRALDGQPLVLLSNGMWHLDLMKRAKVQAEDVMAAARGNNIRSLDQIQYAILERNGVISIIKRED